MLDIKSNGLPSGDDDPEIPNVPDIPAPGDPPYAVPTHPPTEHELKAVTGGNMGGVAEELSKEVVSELGRQGITKEAIIALAAAWGVSQVQAAAISLGRLAADNLNRQFSKLFGGAGGGGGEPPIKFAGPNTSDGGSGPSGGGPSGAGSHQHPFLNSHLDTNAKPDEVTLNVGLKVPSLVPYFKEYVANYTSPVHLTCVIPRMPDDEGYTLGRFNNKAILLRFIERVSRSINQNLDANTFTPANLNTYFNNVLKGLAIYYFYESIYAYAKSETSVGGSSISKPNTNDGLICLRRNLSASDLNNLVLLRGCLASLPIPPNMVAFVYWMYQNWQVHSLGDSPVIKFCPMAISQATGLPDPSEITTITDYFNSSTARSLTSVLVKSFDEWYKQDLPASCEVLAHNTDFNTLWANAPAMYVDSASGGTINWRMPGVSNPANPVSYHTYSDELDGLVVGCTAIYDASSTGKWAPSILSPVESVWGTVTQNRFSFTGYTTKFQTIYNKANLTIQRPETCRFFPTFTTSGITLGPTTVVHDPFSERLLGVNIETVSEIGMSALMWILNFDNYNNIGTGTAGNVSPYAPRGKALASNDNFNASKGNKKSWTVRKNRTGQSPKIDKTIDDIAGGGEL